MMANLLIAGMIPPPSGALYRDPFITDRKVVFGNFITSMQTVLRGKLIYCPVLLAGSRLSRC